MPQAPLLRWLPPSLSLLVLTAGMSPLAGAAPPPEAEAALGIKPLHAVDYDQPTGAEAKACTVAPEKQGTVTSWVVRAANGQTLRRFADTNSDNQVDAWCYFKDGVEVYRDVDSNFDRKADQHRWFNAGGSKWGVDNDQDEQIDAWKQISPQEVAEELVAAIKGKDVKAFQRLLISEQELSALELDPAVHSQFAAQIADAAKKFQALATRQQTLSAGSRYVDFGAARPGALPSPPGVSRPDVIVYEGASALVETGGKTEQLQLGVLVRSGEAWRLAEAPQLGGDTIELSGVFALSRFSSSTGGAAPPSDKMQELMEDLEKLDARMGNLAAGERAKLVGQREEKLAALIKVTQDPQLREQWYLQLADMYSSAAMEGFYPQGVQRLNELHAVLEKSDAGEDLVAHVHYLLVWSDWVLKNQNPKLDFTKVQDDWVQQLRSFVKQHPNTPDTAEAYLQLGMTLEFAGETDEALEWYGKLAKDFAGTPKGDKGRGAARRLKLAGSPMTLAGPSLEGGSLDLSKYRGKHVLVHYWATWYEPSKTEMAVLKEALAKYGKRGFDVLGVNLDTSPAAAKAYLAENRYPWRHVYDQDGLEGRLANEMGVMTLPLMILVDGTGTVVNQNVHATELDAELKRVLK